MAITDKEVIEFSDQVIRPLSERFEDLRDDCANAGVKFDDVISVKTPNDPAEILQDNRPSDTDLSGEDIHNSMGRFGAFVTLVDTPATRSILNKPTVRRNRRS